jgi:hypothetical protein
MIGLHKELRYKNWALSGGVIALALMVLITATTKAIDGRVQVEPIVYVSFGVFAVGAILATVDIRRLHSEWRALGVLEKSGSHVDERTIVGRRVKRVAAAAVGRRVDPGFRDGEKAIAQTELASVGAAVQFIAGVLLVLTVVGTFAGMREALPKLAAAMGDIAGTTQEGGQGLPVRGLSEAIKEVAQAVGANLFALIGSVALSIAAFGAVAERRGFLVRLENVSPALLYSKLPVEAEATELQRAVIELQRSAERIAGVERAIDGLAVEFSGFGTKLETMLGEVSQSMGETVRLHALQTHDRLNDQVTRIAAALEATTTALQATAVSYQGLVAGLEERDIGLAAATEAFRAQATELHEVQRGIGNSVLEARTALDGMLAASAGKLAESFDASMESYEARMGTAFTQLSGILAEGSARFADVARRDLGSGLASAVDDAAARLTSAILGTTEQIQKSLDTTGAQVAERIGTAGEVVIGTASVQREEWLRTLRQLPEELTAALVETIARMPRDDSATRELVKALVTLGSTVGELRQEIGRHSNGAEARVRAGRA